MQKRELPQQTGCIFAPLYYFSDKEVNAHFGSYSVSHKQVILTEILLSLLNEGNQTNKKSIFFILLLSKICNWGLSFLFGSILLFGRGNGEGMACFLIPLP